jgi:hypothetical protein
MKKVILATYDMMEFFEGHPRVFSLSRDGGVSAGFTGPIYHKLVPPEGFMPCWRKHKNEALYLYGYKKSVLDRINVYEVADELGDGAVLMSHIRNLDGTPNNLKVVRGWLREQGRVDAEYFRVPLGYKSPKKKKRPTKSKQRAAATSEASTPTQANA